MRENRMHGSRWRREETRPVGPARAVRSRRLSPTLLTASMFSVRLCTTGSDRNSLPLLRASFGALTAAHNRRLAEHAGDASIRRYPGHRGSIGDGRPPTAIRATGSWNPRASAPKTGWEMAWQYPAGRACISHLWRPRWSSRSCRLCSAVHRPRGRIAGETPITTPPLHIIGRCT